MITGFNLIPILPEIFLALSGMGLLMVGAAHGDGSTKAIIWGSVAALFIAATILLKMSWHDSVILSGMYRFDYFAGFMQALIMLGLASALLLSVNYLRPEGMERFE